MIARRIPQRGDVHWLNLEPVSGREMQGRPLFVVISPKETNAFGVSLAVAITRGGAASRSPSGDERLRGWPCAIRSAASIWMLGGVTGAPLSSRAWTPPPQPKSLPGRSA